MKEEEWAERYQIRYAAGLYWILDMYQKGVPYQKPLAVNEIGADIWRLLKQGRQEEEIAEALCQKYHADKDRIREDIIEFRAKLHN